MSYVFSFQPRLLHACSLIFEKLFPSYFIDTTVDVVVSKISTECKHTVCVVVITYQHS